MAEELELITDSAEETQALGRALGAVVQIGDLFLLSGDLGTGKTTLTQGIAWGAGVTTYAHSPTFVLVHQYAGRITLYHLDLYRLESLLEVSDLGVDEMLSEGACVVEWAEKAEGVFPAEHLSVELWLMHGLGASGAEDEGLAATGMGGGSADRRCIRLTAHGERYVALLAELRSTAARGSPSR